MKRFDEYSLGEKVLEGKRGAGVIIDMVLHPVRHSLGYLLVRNEQMEFTVFLCLTDGRCGLALARNVPEQVMRSFLLRIGEGLPLMPNVPRKYPVIIPSKAAPAELPEVTASPPIFPAHEETRAPYFDFV